MFVLVYAVPVHFGSSPPLSKPILNMITLDQTRDETGGSRRFAGAWTLKTPPTCRGSVLGFPCGALVWSV